MPSFAHCIYTAQCSTPLGKKPRKLPTEPSTLSPVSNSYRRFPVPASLGHDWRTQRATVAARGPGSSQPPRQEHAAPTLQRH